MDFQVGEELLTPVVGNDLKTLTVVRTDQANSRALLRIDGPLATNEIWALTGKLVTNMPIKAILVQTNVVSLQFFWKECVRERRWHW